MAGIEFEEPQYAAPAPVAEGSSGITGLVIRWGLAKDARSAGYVLLGVACIAVVLAAVIPAAISRSSGAPVPESIVNAKMQLPRPAP